jgi:hypothetical protein
MIGLIKIQFYRLRISGILIDFESIKDRLNGKLEIKTDDNTNYEAYYNGKLAGRLDLFDYDDNGALWLWNVEVSERYKGMGIGLSLLNEAVKDNGEIYISTAKQSEHRYHNEGDIRFLTPDGIALINSALRNGIIKEGWLFNPFEIPENPEIDPEE